MRKERGCIDERGIIANHRKPIARRGQDGFYEHRRPSLRIPQCDAGNGKNPGDAQRKARETHRDQCGEFAPEWT